MTGCVSSKCMMMLQVSWSHLTSSFMVEAPERDMRDSLVMGCRFGSHGHHGWLQQSDLPCSLIMSYGGKNCLLGIIGRKMKFPICPVYMKSHISLTIFHQSLKGRAKCHTHPTFGIHLALSSTGLVENGQWNVKFHVHRTDRKFFFFTLCTIEHIPKKS